MKKDKYCDVCGHKCKCGKGELNTIYLSGKVSGLNRKSAEENFETMVRYVLKNYKIGVKIIDPLSLCRYNWLWLKCMIVCLRALWTADCILMHPSYKHSYGARIELFFAKIWGKKVDYFNYSYRISQKEYKDLT